MISAGMIATVLTIGALLAPLLAWNDGVARNAGDRSQTLRLSGLPKQGTAPRATPSPSPPTAPATSPPGASARR